MEAYNIDVISRELIKPSSPTPHHCRELKLSLLDQCTPQIYMRILFFFQNHSKVPDPSQTTLLLKQSLSECLTEYYPLAGKLNEDQSLIDCDDSGVLFVEAKVDTLLAEAVRNAPYESYGQYLPFDQMCSSGGEAKISATYPRNEILLAVQVSWFTCGGNAIGVSLSHTLGDLMSLVMFMSSWAAINRGGSPKLVPNFETWRNLFPPRDSPYKFSLPEVKGKISCKRFLFNEEKLMELKELAISSSSSSVLVNDPTRVEVITAFLLKQFINVERAMNTIQNDSSAAKTRFKVWHAVNLRGRMGRLALTSKADEFPFGNLSTIATASFTTGDYQNEDLQNLPDYGDLVTLTRTAIRKVNEDYVLNSIVPSLDSFGKSSTTETEEEEEEVSAAAEQQPRERLILFTSWIGFPWNEVDFGWGKPSSFGPAGTRNTTTTRVVLMSSGRDDGVEAWIYMFEDEVPLLPDELLSLAAVDHFK